MHKQNIIVEHMYSVQTNQTEMSHKQLESPVRSSPGREGQTDGQTDKIKRVQRL